MPFSSNEELPERVKNNIPSERGKDIFRNAFNSSFDEGNSESVAFATGWAALENAGFTQNEGGEWVKKSMPDAGDVHVPSTRRDFDKDEDGFVPPKAAQDNAKKVLRWREEHPDEIEGMTEVGWRRANQLASGEAISLDTVKRISQFARHLGNADVAEEHKGKPWMDAGHVAILGWGGREGIEWAQRVVDREEEKEKTEKRYFHDDAFTTPMEAQARSHDLGMDGHIHVHQSDDGQAIYMPGSSHEEYMETMNGLAQAVDEYHQYEHEYEGGLKGMIKELKELLFGKKEEKEESMPEPIAKQQYEVTGKVLKIDNEQRIVYGWASVITEKGEPVVDTQGDIIGPDELVKAVNDFMKDERVGKVMHEGEPTGMIVHSMPLTMEIAKALGIETEREGWIVGYYVSDDAVWKRVKDGDFKGFSIGGEANRVAVDE